MNRKMFNRNARNKLNAMGGVASFQLGGSPLMATNPLTKSRGSRGIPTSGIGAVQDINPELINLLGITRPRAPGRGGGISGLSLKEMPLRPQGVMENIFQPESTLQSAQAQSMMGGSPLSTGVSPGFQQAVTGSPVGAPSQDKLLDVFKQISGAPNPLDTLKDQERMQQGQISPVLQEQRDVAEEENLIAGEDPQKKIIKPKPIATDKSVSEEEKGIAGELKRDDIITDEQRKQEGQLGTISFKSPKEVADVINKGNKEQQEVELKQLMQEFTQNAPKYEGLDKSLATAKIFFSIAAGKDPDAITNIAAGLEKGADMFIKDKKQKDEFNRQVKLSALQYGLGEKTKLAAEQRLVTRQIDKERRAIQNYVAGKGGVKYRGKTYAEGTDVPVRMADIYDNKAPTNLMTDSTVKALAAKAKSFNDLSKQAIKSGTATLPEIRANQEKYAKAVDSAAKAEIGIGIAESALVKVAEDGSEILGLSGSFNTLLNQGALALGMNLKGYDKKEDLQKDFQIMLQKLIPTTLANTQSANSISNRDVDFLITAFFGPGALEGGPLAFVTQDPDIMKDRIQSAMTEMRNAQRGDFATMSDAELLLGNAFAPGSQGTKTAEGFLASQKKRARELGVAPGQQAKTTFGLQSTGKKDDQGRMIFKIG